MHNSENISGNINRLREKRNWTKEDLAEKLAIDPQLITYWEDGSIQPDIKELGKLADIFDVSVDSLYSDRIEDIVIEEGTTINSEDDEYETEVQRTNTVKLLNKIKELAISIEGNSALTVRKSDDENAYITVNGSEEFRKSVFFNEENDALALKVQSYKKQNAWGINFDFSGSGRNDAVILELPSYENRQLSAEVSGAPDIELQVAFENMNIAVAGSGDIEMAEVDNLNLEIAGAADVEVEKVKDFVVSIAGAGDLEIDECTGNANVSINGSGDVKIGTSNMQDLDVYIAGSGELKSDASVQDANINLVGSGVVRVREVRGTRKFNKVGGGKFIVDND